MLATEALGICSKRQSLDSSDVFGIYEFGVSRVEFLDPANPTIACYIEYVLDVQIRLVRLFHIAGFSCADH